MGILSLADRNFEIITFKLVRNRFKNTFTPKCLRHFFKEHIPWFRPDYYEQRSVCDRVLHEAPGGDLLCFYLEDLFSFIFNAR